MRITLTAALLLGACPALADTIEAPATINSVTLFPQGAQVVRQVQITGPSGTNEVLVPGLPKGTDISSLRVSGDGVSVGAVSLIDGRAPALAKVDSAPIKAARERLAQAREALANAKDQVATIEAKAQAARDQITFLKGAGTQVSDPSQLQAIAQVVGDQILAASERAIAAEADARRAREALDPQEKAVKQAQAALDALENPAKDHDVLRAMVQGSGTLTITSFVDNAGWQPTYDLRLDRAAGKLDMTRYVSVHQSSGEDWRDVDLTLSTARPGAQSAPSEVYPRQVSSGPPRPVMPLAKSNARVADMAGAPAPMMEAAFSGTAKLQMQGETVTYHYPSKVDLRDGVDDLRLKLDDKVLPVEVIAEAAPLSDPQAYRVAEGKNATGEILLPGPATLFVGGALVGQTQLPMIAAGDDLHLGFGAIEGLRLSRTEPDTSEGDRGIISKSNERREVVQITVKNLTQTDWPMRVIDRVPYSEQDDLKVSTSFSPKPETTEYGDKRGVVAWRFDLPAGAEKELRSETVLTWPADQVLR